MCPDITPVPRPLRVTDRLAASHEPSSLRARLQRALGDAYHIERELGGGMSRVFAAREVRLDRVVVVKVLPPELGAALSAERFRREISLAARLQHPHIVPVHAAGEVEGIPWYTMPFIEGESLRERLQGGPLPIADALRVLHDVADALAYAHAQGVIHRDIKPDNILLTRGHAVVTDFGVAKALAAAAGDITPLPGALHGVDHHGHRTGAGLAIGTPAYMAPEQATGDPYTDGRADLYALGVVAWETLAGRAIFGRRLPHELLAAHITEQPIPVEELRPDVPPALAALVARCIEKRPGDRPRDAAAVRDALAELGAGLSGGSGSGGRPAFAWSGASGAGRGRGARWPIVAALAAAVIAVGSAAWFLLPRATPPDETVVAVLPFQVTGGSSLGYLREGMLDLLAAKLTGEGGPRSAEPRAVLSAWRRAAGSDTGSLPRDQMLALAEKVGAGQALTGEIAGDVDRLVLSASLIRVKDGRIIVSEQEPGPADSLPQLLDRLVAKLLARSAGEGERLPVLASTPLPALRAYLAGQAAFRRGRYNDAVREYSRALDVDSSFTLAALGLVDATGWVGGSHARQRGARIAWRGKDALSERDQARLMALVGSRYPMPTPYAEQHVANQRYARVAPDRPEAQFQFGDGLFHYGRVIGIRDAHALAKEAFQRALLLDSTFVPALEHLVLLAAKDGDTTRAVQFATRYLAIDGSTESANGVRWRLAALRGDREEMVRLTPRIARQGGTSFAYLMGVSMFEGVAPALAQRAFDTAMAHASALPDRASHAMAAHDLALARGRPREATRMLRKAADAGVPPAAVLREQVKDALFWDGDTLAGAQAVRELEQRTPESALAAGTLTAGADSARMPEYVSNVCVLERWRLAHGQTSTVRRSLSWLRAFVTRRPGPMAQIATQCAITMDAQLAVAEQAPDAPSRVKRLDSLLLSGPGGSVQDVGNLVVARLMEQSGNVKDALEAVRRREYVFTRGAYLSTYLREEGRLAELAGDVEGAIAAYRQFLALREDAEPELRDEVEDVRERLARLIREGSEK